LCSTLKVPGQVAAPLVWAEALEADAQAQHVPARASATRVRVLARAIAAR
jgi:hypothetical protein